jgi:hypothetical protein
MSRANGECNGLVRWSVPANESLALIRISCFSPPRWIAKWSDAVDTPIEVFGRDFPPQKDGRSAQAQYVTVYCVIIFLSMIATALRSQWAVAGGARCAEKMFILMTDRILRAPMSYFETTP